MDKQEKVSSTFFFKNMKKKKNTNLFILFLRLLEQFLLKCVDDISLEICKKYIRVIHSNVAKVVDKLCIDSAHWKRTQRKQIVKRARGKQNNKKKTRRSIYI